MRTWRKVAALLLIVAGALMLIRGIHYAFVHNLGWQGFIVPIVTGSLVIALGVARWRYWQGGDGNDLQNCGRRSLS